jgi:hypothetical protein
LYCQQPLFDELLQGYAQGGRAGVKCSQPFVEGKHRHALASLCSCYCVRYGYGRFSNARAAHQQCAGAPLQSTSKQRIQLNTAALHKLSDKRSVMFGRHKPGEYLDASRFNNEVVIAAPKLDAAHFLDAQATTFRAIIECKLLQDNDAVRDAVQLNVALLRRKIVQQKHRAATACEEVFESQHLAPIP